MQVVDLICQVRGHVISEPDLQCKGFRLTIDNKAQRNAVTRAKIEDQGCGCNRSYVNCTSAVAEGCTGYGIRPIVVNVKGYLVAGPCIDGHACDMSAITIVLRSIIIFNNEFKNPYTRRVILQG